ncbi:MAG: hypothetical protein AAFY15_00160 [Cyanobacteria bacterium J06648_11]
MLICTALAALFQGAVPDGDHTFVHVPDVPAATTALQAPNSSLRELAPSGLRGDGDVGLFQSLGFLQNMGSLPSDISHFAWIEGGLVRILQDGSIDHTFVASDSDQALTVRQRVIGLNPSVGKRYDSLSTSSTVSIFGPGSPPQAVQQAGLESLSLGTTDDGIEAELRHNGRSVELLFHVPPGANSTSLAVGVDGISGWEIGPDGAFRASALGGEVVLSAPRAFEGLDRRDVEVEYQAHANGYGFRVGSYDQDQPLSIDPILSATFIGGSSNDSPADVDVAADGSVYVCGSTLSPNFPATVGTIGPAVSTDGYIAHLDADLSAPIGIVLFGGSDIDSPFGIYVSDSTGDVTIAGTTWSDNFPGAEGPVQGKTDGLVARFNGALNTITAANRIVGSGDDSLFAIEGSYVVGWIEDPVNHGVGRAAYIARLNSDLSIFTERSINTIDSNTEVFSDVIAAEGQVYAVGVVNQDACVARYDAALLQASSDTLLDFGALNSGVDEFGNVAFNSSNGQLVLSGAFDGQSSGLVATMAIPSLSLLSAIQLGGSGSNSSAGDVDVNGSGEIFVTGYTNSPDFPLTIHADQLTFADGGLDAFFVRLDSGLSFLYGTYLGASNGSENAGALDLQDERTAVIYLGTAGSAPASAPGWDPSPNGGNGTYLARITVDPLTPAFGTNSVSLSTQGSQSLVLDPGIEFANSTFLMLGSISGTSPGIPLNGLVVPLQPDAYFDLVLSNPALVLSNGGGALDSFGQAVVTFTVPAGVSSGIVGATLNHAFILISADGSIAFASNAASVSLAL